MEAALAHHEEFWWRCCQEQRDSHAATHEVVPGLPAVLVLLRAPCPLGSVLNRLKSGCLLQGLQSFLIAARQIIRPSAESLKAAAGVWTGRLRVLQLSRSHPFVLSLPLGS